MVVNCFDDFLGLGRGVYVRLEVAGDCDVSSDSVHNLLEILRVGRLKSRLSREACPDFLQRIRSVKYPPVVIPSCPLGRYGVSRCSSCSARISPCPIYDDGEKVIKCTVYDLPDYLCACALTGARCM